MHCVLFATIHLAPIGPTWLLVGIALAILAAVVVGSVGMYRCHVPTRWIAGLGLLRVLAWSIFVLVLLQPSFAWSRHIPMLPELLILVDTSRSMGQASRGDGTRLDEVRALLERSDLREALDARFRVQWVAFDRTVYRLKPEDIKSLSPSEHGARLSQSFGAAYELLAAEDSRPQQILLVSDGNDRDQADAVQLARHLGVRVDVLSPSDRDSKGSQGVAIADVQAARRVLLGSETHFRVSLRADPPATQDTRLTLRLAEDGKELEAVAVDLKAGQAEETITLAHRPATIGTKTYRFALDGPGAAAGSVKKAVVDVIDSKYEVLVLEDTWRWEYKFLHRLFEDDPSFRFTAILPRGKNAFVQFASPDRRVNLVGFPQTGADLEGFDVIFLGDVQASRWPRGLPAALARLVADEGKSLVVLAGPQLGKLADIPALHALLPVDVSRASGSPISGAVDVRLRGDAASSPFFFQLAKDTDDLPPLDHVYPVVRKRPGATVLLEAPKERNDYGPLIVMAEHVVGRGRVLFIATDTLWKWQTLAPPREGPTPYAIFWQQALRGLTPQRSQLGPVQVWVTPARSQVAVGQPLPIEVEVQSTKPLGSQQLEGMLTDPVGKRWPLALNADPADPLRYRTEALPQVAGTHHVSVAFLLDGKTAAEGHTDLDVEEAADASSAGINRFLLRRLASATGGRWIDPGNPATWPTADTEPIGTIEQPATFDLWSTFTLLLILCTVLGVDWVLRIMKGFV
jgi:hypothetical protein